MKPLTKPSEPIEPSQYAATAVDHLREQHKKQDGRYSSYDDVALTFNATLQPGVKYLLNSMCNKKAFVRKVPEGADTRLVLDIANKYLPKNGVVILPDREERDLADFTGGAPEFTHMDQLAALGRDIAAHSLKERPSARSGKGDVTRSR